MLEACSQAFASEPSLKFNLQKLASAFLMDAAKQVANPAWLVATRGLPSVDPDVLEQVLGEQRVKQLCEHGFLSWVDIKALGPRLLIRVEELLAHHVAEEWSDDLVKLSDQDSVASELERLLRLSVAIPEGEIALAAAIIRAGQKNPTVLNVAIPYLVEQKPTTSRLTEGARGQLLVKGARIDLHLGKGMDEEVLGNIEPWVVLSHIASWPIKVDSYEVTLNFSIFVELGTSRHFLYRPRPTELARVPCFHFHDIDGIGSILCPKTGIVEPLLQAMLGHAHTYPDEFVSLAKYAMDKKEAHLAWRVLTVAIASKASADERVQRAAEEVEEVLRDWWGDAFNHI